MTLPLPVRSLLRARGVSLAVIAMVAAGTAAAVAAFGVVDAALWRPPPFDQHGRVVLPFIMRTPHLGSAQSAVRRERWSWQRAQLLRTMATSFDAVATVTPTTVSLTTASDAESVTGEIVSHDYFAVLGVAPSVGRAFVATDDAVPREGAVAILSHDLWIRRFGGDTAAIGQALGINGGTLTIIGVMPPGVRGLSDRAEFWMPPTMAPALTYGDYLVTNQNFMGVVALLKRGVTLEAADAELRVVGRRIDAERPSARSDPTDVLSATAMSVNEARTEPHFRLSVLLLGAGVLLVYLLGCANAVNLLLSRQAARRREAAVRAALGASRRQLFAHSFAEGALIAVAGSVAGIAVAAWLSKYRPPVDVWASRGLYGTIGAFSSPEFGGRSLAFGFGLMLLSVIIVACWPALAFAKEPAPAELRDGSRGAASGFSLRRPTARGILVAVECSLAMVLLLTGGLLVDSFGRMVTTGLGVDASHVLSFWIMPGEARVTPAKAPALINRLLGAIRAVPGVEAASVDGGAPVAGSASSVLYVMGRPAPPPNGAPPVDRHYVGPEHFATLRIPVLRGRVFTDEDIAGRPRVCVISETAEKRFWPGEDAIGQRVWFGGGSNFNSPDSSAEIVGVVGDVVYESLDVAGNRASFYTPYAQFTYPQRNYFVRVAGDPAAWTASVRAAVHSVEPDLALVSPAPLEDQIGKSWARHQFDAWLFGGFGLLALILAASGIFAAVAFSVGQRTREMGIRLALGARPSTVVKLVVSEGMALPVVGLAVGAAASLASGRLISASLYHVSPADPVVLLATAALLGGVAAVACYVPALRATRVDPLDALRAD